MALLWGGGEPMAPPPWGCSPVFFLGGQQGRKAWGLLGGGVHGAASILGRRADRTGRLGLLRP